MQRKTAQIATARACGERFARAHRLYETEPMRFLTTLDNAALTSRERAARRGLLPATWQGAFSRGWRDAGG
jgi:hypothetical protein